MKLFKIKMALVIILAIIGAIFIYQHFEKEKENNTYTNKYDTDYTFVEKENKLVKKSIDDIINAFDKTAIIFICNKDLQMCQKYAYYLNEAAINNNVNEIQYLDITTERTLNTNKYKKLVKKLNDYLYSIENQNKEIYMPDVTFVKDGKIIAHYNLGSIYTELDNAENINNELQIMFSEAMLLLKEENNYE